MTMLRGPGLSESPDSRPLLDAYREFFPRVFAYGCHALSSPADARKVAVEVFWIAAQGGPPPGRSYASWLFGIAHSSLQAYKRRLRRRGSDAGDDPQSSRRPAQAGGDDALVTLSACLNQLPERTRCLLSLKFDGQLSNSEIAEVLALTEENVSTTILAGLQRLRYLMTAEESGTPMG